MTSKLLARLTSDPEFKSKFIATWDEFAGRFGRPDIVVAVGRVDADSTAENLHALYSLAPFDIGGFVHDPDVVAPMTDAVSAAVGYYATVSATPPVPQTCSRPAMAEKMPASQSFMTDFAAAISSAVGVPITPSPVEKVPDSAAAISAAMQMSETTKAAVKKWMTATFQSPEARAQLFSVLAKPSPTGVAKLLSNPDALAALVAVGSEFFSRAFEEPSLSLTEMFMKNMPHVFGGGAAQTSSVTDSESGGSAQISSAAAPADDTMSAAAVADALVAFLSEAKMSDALKKVETLCVTGCRSLHANVCFDTDRTIRKVILSHPEEPSRFVVLYGSVGDADKLWRNHITLVHLNDGAVTGVTVEGVTVPLSVVPPPPVPPAITFLRPGGDARDIFETWWRRSILDDGFKIGYITSVDTPQLFGPGDRVLCGGHRDYIKSRVDNIRPVTLSQGRSALLVSYTLSVTASIGTKTHIDLLETFQTQNVLKVTASGVGDDAQININNGAMLIPRIHSWIGPEDIRKNGGGLLKELLPAENMGMSWGKFKSAKLGPVHPGTINLHVQCVNIVTFDVYVLRAPSVKFSADGHIDVTVPL